MKEITTLENWLEKKRIIMENKHHTIGDALWLTVVLFGIKHIVINPVVEVIKTLKVCKEDS